jgi:mRNA-degrading endonuclease toxin of MazEF toxin-antitoxin module
MKQWDIFLFPYPTPADPHMAVVISNNGICANPSISAVNVLPCQTVRPLNRGKKDNEVYLDSGDGLDWKTLVKCDFVLVFNKNQAIEKRGEVCPQRVAEIRKKLQEYF